MVVKHLKLVHLFVVGLFLHGGYAKKDSKKRFVVEVDLEQQLNTLQAEFNAFKIQTIAQLQNTGSTFVRWGKNDCPTSAEFIYRGYIAGKRYNEAGSSSDSLCLPVDPSWANYTDTHQRYRSTIYGTEIDLADPGNIIFGKSVMQQDMPCAVCRTTHATTLMVPARSSCYPGWTRQYMGYLVSNMAEAGRGSYDMICLDGDPDFVAHGGTNDDQHVVYVTEAHCGSLPCPPYVENRELACSVCSK